MTAPISLTDRRRGAAGAAFALAARRDPRRPPSPGQALSENEVAQRLGVSRTPVREAIIRLESEGLLTVRPQVGTTVAPIDVEAVADVPVPARGDRMPHGRAGRAQVTAGRRARAARATEASRRGVAAARRPCRPSCRSTIACMQTLVAMAGRPRVWRAVEEAKAQLDRVRFLSLEDPAWLATIHRQHEDIVEHVLAGRRRWRRRRDGRSPARRVRVHRDDRPHQSRVLSIARRSRRPIAPRHHEPGPAQRRNRMKHVRRCSRSRGVRPRGAALPALAQTVLNVNTALTTDDPMYAGLERMKANVEKRTAGKLTIRIYPGLAARQGRGRAGAGAGRRQRRGAGRRRTSGAVRQGIRHPGRALSGRQLRPDPAPRRRRRCSRAGSTSCATPPTCRCCRSTGSRAIATC